MEVCCDYKNLNIENQVDFQPTWPKALEPTLSKKICTFVWNLLSLIVFPIALIRLANHYVIRPLALQYLLLPAARPTALAIDIHNNIVQPIAAKMGLFLFDLDPITSMKDDQTSVESFPTPHGERIKKIYVKGDKYPDKLIIACGGNGALAESTLSQIARVAKGYSILVIDPIGVGGSGGYPGRDGLDFQESSGLPVYSAYEHARECLGYAPENIILYGFSLGGASATLGAVDIQEKYGADAVNIVNDRSLRSTAEVGIAWIKLFLESRKNKPFSECTFIEKLIKCVAHIPDCMISLVVRCALYVTGLNIDAESAWLKLQSKNKCILYAKKDWLIPFEGASLFKGVENKSSFDKIELSDDYEHCDNLEGPEKIALRKTFKKYTGG